MRLVPARGEALGDVEDRALRAAAFEVRNHKKNPHGLSQTAGWKAARQISILRDTLWQLHALSQRIPVIIETFGLAAAGKSTYARKLAAERGLRNITIRSTVEKMFFYWLFRLLHPRLAAFLAKRCVEQSRDLPQLRHHKWELFRKAVGREQKARLFGSGVIDEGLVNFLLTLYEDIIPGEDLVAYGNLLPAKNREIHIVETNAESRAERLAARAKSTRQKFGDAYFARWSRIVEENHRIVDAWIRENYDYRVIAS